MSETFVAGRSRENAILLLAATKDLGLSPQVVRTTTNGYLVPEQVAKQAFGKPEKKAEPKPAPKVEESAESASAEEAPKKAPAKKAAKKKTAPKE